VDDAIEDGVGIGGIADQLVPFVDGDLAGDDCRSAPVALFEDLEQVVTRGGVERLETPVVEDEQLHAEACIAHLRFPVTHRRAIRTTNLLERLFVEERRRLKIIPNAFGERVVLKLMFGALIRAAERWRSIKVTEFEHRQITAVRKELDQEYETQVGLKTQPSKDAAQVKISSSSRT
jgi:Transposase, Mutator family